MSASYFDSLETRDPEAREASQFTLLADLVAQAIDNAPGWAKQLAGVDPRAVNSRAALSKLPVLRKTTLKDLQQTDPPLGGFATGRAAHIFASPGPIYEPEGYGSDFWRAARALYAAGFREGDIVHNTFAYHLTPGGWILDSGARALGCTVVPAGPGNTEQQLDAISHIRPTGFIGVPDYLKILLDKASEAGSDASSINKAMVGGGALFPSLRQEYSERGISCMQCYATADLGVAAYESATPDGPTEGMIVDEGVIMEIVRPGTGDPVPDGEVGEIVVTTFNKAYPMIRFATGDLSAVLADRSPCGRTNMRIKGWMGRADQTTKVKGMFVHPEQIAAIAKRHPELARLRLVVTRENEQDVMTLHAETENRDSAFADTLAASLRDLTKLSGAVELKAPGSLANDGKVIADDRSYD